MMMNDDDELQEEREQETSDTADVVELETDRSEMEKEVGPVGSRHYVTPASMSSCRVFAGNGNAALASEVCSVLGTQLGRARVTAFADGEVDVQLLDNVRGKNCYIVQSLHGPNVNQKLMELLLMVSSLRRASAERIIAVIPYFAYARQLDNTTYNRTTIAAADVARMMEAVGVDQVVAVDLHRPQLIGFFENIPVENLDTQAAAIPYLVESKGLRDHPTTVVVPVGSTVKRAVKFRNALERAGVRATMGFSYPVSQGKVVGSDDQHHSKIEEISTDGIEVLGDVKGRDVIIVDDMIDSASRVASTAKAIKARGARAVYAYATHGLFTGDAAHRINESPLKEVIVFNTVPLPKDAVYTPRIQQLSAAGLIAETIDRLNKKKSITHLLHNLAEYS